MAGESFAQADVDRDGRPDIAYLSMLTANEGERRARLTVVPAGGLSGSARVTELDGAASCLSLADVTGDGSVDAAVVYGGRNSERERVTYVALLAGHGDGRFTPQGRPARLAGFDTAHCGQADLDGDGEPELALAGRGREGAVLVVAELAATGATRVRTALALPGPSEAMTLGDVDGNGRVDVLLSRASAELAVDVVRLGAAGSRAPLGAVLETTRLDNDSYAFASGVQLGDIDADSDLDLVLAGSDTRNAMPHGYQLGPVIAVSFGDGSGRFGPPVAYQLAAGGDEFGEHVLVGDFDGDGQDDMALSTFGEAPAQQRIGVLLGPRD